MGPQTVTDKAECERVIAVVGKFYGFSRRQLVGPARTAALAFARKMAIWELRNRTPLTLQYIGGLFNRTHSGACALQKQTDEAMEIYPSARRDAAELAKLLDNQNNGDSVNK